MNSYVLAVLSGVLFGTWPIIMRASGLHPLVAAIFINIASSIVLIPFWKSEMNVSVTKMGILLVLVAGAINGIGHLCFQSFIANKDFEIARGIFVQVLFVLFASTVLGALFWSEGFTARKIAGFVAAVVAVYLLTTN